MTVRNITPQQGTYKRLRKLVRKSTLKKELEGSKYLDSRRKLPKSDHQSLSVLVFRPRQIPVAEQAVEMTESYY